MKFEQYFRNKNWYEISPEYDDDGYIEYDPTENMDQKDVRKFVTLGGDIFIFTRVNHPWYKRLWYDFISYF